MSASAGRVLLIPKGDYDSSVTYNMLDMVFYGGKTYVCKQTSKGNAPTNTVYWQIMLDGASTLSELTDVQLNNLQDGDGIYWDATAQKWKNTTPTSIAVTSPPAKTEYIKGEILDLTGLVVTAYFTGGATRNVTSECVFSPANGATLTTSNTVVNIEWATFTTTQAITVNEPIYGVQWDGSSSPVWTRTDASASFVDPVPYYSGMSETPSSPFDSILPWSGMTTSERSGGTMVRIPKFYYKITQTGTNLKIQISASRHTGFHVSPAHMDRGDNAGERDYVYVGKYKCAYLSFKSEKNKKPVVSETRSNFRTYIHQLGTKIWQMDFATLFTIWLLYLVEYANWNSQTSIGVGGGAGSAVANMGYTASLSYHTGTSKTARTLIGLGTQYRNIEGLWDNCYEFIDGIYSDNGTMKVILNPSDFSDSTGGISVGQFASGGVPTQITTSDETGAFPIFFASSASGSNYDEYICDNWNDLSYSNLFHGCNYISTSSVFGMGLFYLQGGSASTSTNQIGSRLMELP